MLAKGRSQLFRMVSDLTIGDVQNFEKLGKKSIISFFFQSRGAKKSKIAGKISSRLEVLKRDRVKIVSVWKYPLKYDPSN